MPPSDDRAIRIAAAAVALIGTFGLILQTIWLDGTYTEGLGATLAAMARYFTTLTNALAVAIFAGIALTGRWRAPVLAALVVNLVMVSVVYYALLSDLWSPSGIGWWADLMLHGIVPWASVIFWLRFGAARPLQWRHLPLFLIWPAAYTVYTLALGAMDGTYPYPFLDPSQAGATGVALNIAGLGLAVAVGAAGVIALSRWRGRQSRPD